MARPRFLADAMLGDIARWLRILGEDCVYADPSWSDDEVMDRARPGDRVIVTRDAHLVRRATNRALRAILLPQVDTVDNLETIYRELGLRPDQERAVTRCSRCNGALRETDQSGVQAASDLFEPEGPLEDVLDRHETFWVCQDCGQVYWKGTHWDSIQRTREALAARLGDVDRSDGPDGHEKNG